MVVKKFGHLESLGYRALQLMSVSAAARHFGFKSRLLLYKLMNDGWLDAHVHIQMQSGQRLLGMQKMLQGLCQGVSMEFLRRQWSIRRWEDRQLLLPLLFNYCWCSGRGWQ